MKDKRKFYILLKKSHLLAIIIISLSAYTFSLDTNRVTDLFSHILNHPFNFNFNTFSWDAISSIANLITAILTTLLASSILISIKSIRESSTNRNAEQLQWIISEMSSIKNEAKELKNAKENNKIIDETNQHNANMVSVKLQRVGYFALNELISKKHFLNLWGPYYLDQWYILEEWINSERIKKNEPIDIKNAYFRKYFQLFSIECEKNLPIDLLNRTRKEHKKSTFFELKGIIRIERLNERKEMKEMKEMKEIEDSFLYLEFIEAWKMIRSFEKRRSQLLIASIFSSFISISTSLVIHNKQSAIIIILNLIAIITIKKTLQSERLANIRYRKKINLIRETVLINSVENAYKNYISHPDIGINLYSRDPQPSGIGSTLKFIFYFFNIIQIINILMIINILLIF